MRILPLSEVRLKDVLATTLWGANGQMAIREGSVLGESHLNYLQSRGYTSVPVKFPGFEGICPVPWIDNELSKQVIAFLTQLPETFDLAAARTVNDLAGKILDGVLEHPVGALELVPVFKSTQNAVIVAINRALIVAAVGQGTLSESRLIDAIVAALMLDSGPDNALARGVVVDAEDFHLLQAMSTSTMTYLGTVERISSYALATVFQVYARVDGTGLPPVKADKIWEGAQLLAPANKLARLIVDTEEHPAVAPHEALEWIMGGAGTEYALEWVTRMQQRVAPYGVGTAVHLSSGEVGVVLQVPHGVPGRPVVRILSGSRRGLEWDLQDRASRNIAIVGVITTREFEV